MLLFAAICSCNIEVYLPKGVFFKIYSRSGIHGIKTKAENEMELSEQLNSTCYFLGNLPCFYLREFDQYYLEANHVTLLNRTHVTFSNITTHFDMPIQSLTEPCTCSRAAYDLIGNNIYCTDNQNCTYYERNNPADTINGLKVEPFEDPVYRCFFNANYVEHQTVQSDVNDNINNTLSNNNTKREDEIINIEDVKHTYYIDLTNGVLNITCDFCTFKTIGRNEDNSFQISNNKILYISDNIHCHDSLLLYYQIIFPDGFSETSKITNKITNDNPYECCPKWKFYLPRYNKECFTWWQIGLNLLFYIGLFFGTLSLLFLIIVILRKVRIKRLEYKTLIETNDNEEKSSLIPEDNKNQDQIETELEEQLPQIEEQNDENKNSVLLTSNSKNDTSSYNKFSSINHTLTQFLHILVTITTYSLLVLKCVAQTCSGNTGLVATDMTCTNDDSTGYTCTTSLLANLKFTGKGETMCYSYDYREEMRKTNIVLNNYYVKYTSEIIYYTADPKWTSKTRTDEYDQALTSSCGCGFSQHCKLNENLNGADGSCKCGWSYQSWNKKYNNDGDPMILHEHTPAINHCDYSSSYHVFWRTCYDNYRDEYLIPNGNHYAVYDLGYPELCVNITVYDTSNKGSIPYDAELCSNLNLLKLPGYEITLSSWDVPETPNVYIINTGKELKLVRKDQMNDPNSSELNKFGSCQLRQDDIHFVVYPAEAFSPARLICNNKFERLNLRSLTEIITSNSMNFKNGTIAILQNDKNFVAKYYPSGNLPIELMVKQPEAVFEHFYQVTYKCEEFDFSCSVINGRNSSTQIDYSCKCNEPIVPLYSYSNKTEGLIDYLTCDQKKHSFNNVIILGNNVQLGGITKPSTCSYTEQIELLLTKDYSVLHTEEHSNSNKIPYWVYIVAALIAIIAIIAILLLIKRCCFKHSPVTIVTANAGTV